MGLEYAEEGPCGKVEDPDGADIEGIPLVRPEKAPGCQMLAVGAYGYAVVASVKPASLLPDDLAYSFPVDA
jgi:hypothetical protein